MGVWFLETLVKRDPSFVLLAFILLASCSSPSEGMPHVVRQTNPGWITFSKDFIFSYPPEAQYRFDRSDGSVALSTNSGASFLERPTDYSISITELSSASLCTSSLTGASKTIALAHASGKAEWGMVDFFKIYDSGENYIDFDGPHPGCGETHGDAYVLCSQHHAKTILLCISQKTDNPALAKIIFESFRWTQ